MSEYKCPKCNSPLFYHHEDRETVTFECKKCKHFVLARNTDYAIWDLNTPKGREDVLTELRNLERKGLNMFALATKAMNNELSYEEFHEAIKIIYDDIDRKNRNL